MVLKTIPAFLIEENRAPVPSDSLNFLLLTQENSSTEEATATIKRLVLMHLWFEM
jgi:hypothetical protein